MKIQHIKVGSREKFIALNPYIRREGKSQINSLSYTLNKKKSRINPKQAEGRRQ